MKRLLIFILVLIFSSGCGNLSSATTPSVAPTTFASTSTTTLSLVDAAKPVQIIPQTYIEDISLQPELISPSGKEIIVDNNLVNGMPYKAQNIFTLPITTIDGEIQARNVKIQLDIPSTIYFVKAWAPDEKAFAAIFYDKEYFNGSETCCGEAIAITDLNDGNAKTFTYHWGWNHTSQLMWSEDSSKLSVDFSGDYTPLVFDKNGELIKTFPQNSSLLFWSENRLFYTEKKNGNVRLFEYNFGSQESNLILDNVTGSKHVSHNNESSQILLTEYVTGHGDKYSKINEFYVIDTNAKSAEKISLPKSTEILSYRWATSVSQDFVALKGMDNSLWIFNWNNHTFNYYGRIKDLLGWFKNTDGFLIYSLDGKQKIIKP